MSFDQHMTWVVSTDTNTCRIYSYRKKAYQLVLLKEIQHPENKLNDIDLTSDKPGHYKSSGSARGVYLQPSDPKEIKIDAFAREIAKELDQARNAQSFKSLIVIAPPHMNGLLFKHLNKQVENLVSHRIEKDLIHLPDAELLDFLHAHIQYPNES